MPDFLTRILHKSGAAPDAVRPRLPSRYEPVFDPFGPADAGSRGAAMAYERSRTREPSEAPEGPPEAGAHHRSARESAAAEPPAQSARPAPQGAMGGREVLPRAGVRPPAGEPPGPETRPGGAAVSARSAPTAAADDQLPPGRGAARPADRPAYAGSAAAEGGAAPAGQVSPTIPSDPTAGPTDGARLLGTHAELWEQAQARRPVRPVEAHVHARAGTRASDPRGSEPGPKPVPSSDASWPPPGQAGEPVAPGRRSRHFEGTSEPRSGSSVSGWRKPGEPPLRAPLDADEQTRTMEGTGRGPRVRLTSQAPDTPGRRAEQRRDTAGTQPMAALPAQGYGPALRPLRPARAPSEPGAGSGDMETRVHISIGRIEVRALNPSAPAAKPKSSPKVMTLDAYLRGKDGERR